MFERLAGADYNGVWTDVGGWAIGRALSIGAVTGELFPTLASPRCWGGCFRPVRSGRRGPGSRHQRRPLATALWTGPAVLGKPFEITNGSFTIVGVAPGDFDLPQGSDVWVTFAAINPDLLKEDAVVLDLVGRLRPGRTAEEGRRDSTDW